jgi:Na+-transporting NADH:ubiquinone oxidoreductase subunit B
MATIFIGGFVMALIFNLFGLNTLMQISPLHHLALGDFNFVLIFMATDPVSATQTNTGQDINSFLIGLDCWGFSLEFLILLTLQE